jgi:hypothetical protein
MPSIGRLNYLEFLPSPTARARGALVLLHAFPLNARMWEPQRVLAEQGWRVIVRSFAGWTAVSACSRSRRWTTSRAT